MKNSESLKKNRDFQAVYKKGKSFANRLLVMYIKKNGLDKNRIGISVSKKVGNSIVRHRLTRLIREGYRLNEPLFLNGLDMVVVVRPLAKDKTFFDMESALMHLSRMHHIVGINDENNTDQVD